MRSECVFSKQENRRERKDEGAKCDRGKWDSKHEQQRHKRKQNKFLAKHGSTCTICLDDFKSTDKVCLTPCSHVFHYNCLSSWLHKNKINPKCPNCNTILLNEDESQNVEVIQARRAYNNSYQNSFDGTRIQLMQMNRSNENIVS